MNSRLFVRALTVAMLLLVTCASAVGASPSVIPANATCHTVQPGDNLYRISLRMGVSMYALMQANGIRDPNHIYVGQVICAPAPAPVPGPVPNPAPNPVPHPAPVPPPVKPFYHTVTVGETLGSIAARYGTNIYAIMQCSGLSNPNFIYPGQVLCIPTIYTPPPQPVVQGWHAEYFNNEHLAGAPSVVRYDTAIDFDWGLGWPHPKINADRFSVRWTRSLWFATGTYRFTTITDDGVRLYVDNRLVIDQWKEQPVTAHYADVPLGAGYHTVRMEYFELVNLAVAKLRWEQISVIGPIGTPGIPYPPVTSTAPEGWWAGDYFDNMYLGGSPAVTRMDTAINFDWGYNRPAEGMPTSLWSARWTRLAFFEQCTYRFHAAVDDGVRVYVDGQVLIDAWHDASGTEYIADKALTAGKHELRVEYYQKGYTALVKVWMERLN